jgi:microcystin-dependent protein
MTVYSWSATAADNDDADSTINFREGQAPSTINNSGRAMMAAIAKLYADLSGNAVTGGSSSAYTLTTNQVFSALTDGVFVKCRMSATNAAGATLNVDSLGAKTIATVYGTAIRAGALLSGAVHHFVYDSTDDKWIVQGQFEPGVMTGEIKAYAGTAAPSGYVRANGRTIGNAASGASERANADTAALYSLLWDSYGDGVCPVSSGRGANAAADYAANKTIGLPDMRGRAMIGLDDMGNSAAGRLAGATIDQTTNGASGGADTVTLAEGNLPAHTHSDGTLAAASGGAHTHFVVNADTSGSGAGDDVTATDQITANRGGVTNDNYTLGGTATAATLGLTSSNGAHTHDVTGATGSTGSGTAFDILPPAFLTTFIIKL